MLEIKFGKPEFDKSRIESRITIQIYCKDYQYEFEGEVFHTTIADQFTLRKKYKSGLVEFSGMLFEFAQEGEEIDPWNYPHRSRFYKFKGKSIENILNQIRKLRREKKYIETLLKAVKEANERLKPIERENYKLIFLHLI